jgi:predicted enzyme related to lactoylglutathione lyase
MIVAASSSLMRGNHQSQILNEERGVLVDRVTGLGGLFFKAENPEALYAWYEKHLGIKRGPEGAVTFKWHDSAESGREGMTVWAIFPKSTTYFQPSRAEFMMNFRVADLDGLLQALKEEGVEIDPHREDYEYGRFAWIKDPEGNRIELWEPPKSVGGRS